MTRYLLKLGAHVTAIEKDDVLQQKLKDAFDQVVAEVAVVIAVWCRCH